MDFYIDVVDFDVKECFFDKMIEGCRVEFKNFIEDFEVVKYFFSFLIC